MNILSKKSRVKSGLSSLDEAQPTIGARALDIQLDSSNTKTFDSFVAQVKQSLQAKWQTEDFDFLVNNAGTGVYAAFAETTEEDFDHLGLPDDIGGAIAKRRLCRIASLLSEDNKWVNAQRIEVSGGQSI